MQSHGGGWGVGRPGVERSRARWDRAPAFGRVAAGASVRRPRVRVAGGRAIVVR